MFANDGKSNRTGFIINTIYKYYWYVLIIVKLILYDYFFLLGADESIAKNALEACNWNVELAMDMFLDSNLAQTSSSSSTNNPATATNSAPPIITYV